MESIIADRSLAEQGHLKIEWVRQHMPVLNQVREELISTKALTGKKIAICLHLEAKTAYLAKVLHEAGAQVAITGSNPLSTQDDVAAALAEDGVTVYARYGCSLDEYHHFVKKTAEIGPDVLIDDGGDLVHVLHTELTGLLPGIIGGCEETTTGIIRLRAMERDKELAFPMIAVNDAFCKYLFDNRYGTGQSTWDGIMRTTNLVVAGKNVVVAGYGWCGKGVAMRAKGLGASVIVTEVNPIKAIEARMDGFRVMPMLEAAKIGDIFITVTGCKDVITREHFAVMKDGAILANAGHFDVEVSRTDLAAMAQSIRTVRRNIEEYRLEDGRRLYLLGEGRLVNLACADGHPAEIMDMTFALQALSLQYLAQNPGKSPGVYPVPEEIDQKVALMKLAAEGISIDTLSEQQKEYLASWKV